MSPTRRPAPTRRARGAVAPDRGTTEYVIFAARGNLPLKRQDAGTSCSPGPHFDLFARKARRGWTVWGAEAAA